MTRHELDRLRRSRRRARLERLGHRRVEVDRREVEGQLAGLDLRAEEQVADDALETRCVAVDRRQVALLLGGQVRVLAHQLEVPANRGERGSQLVRDECDELVLERVESAQLEVVRLQPLEHRIAFELGFAACRYVDDEPAGEIHALVGKQDCRVVHPHDATVSTDQAVLLVERLAGAPDALELCDDALAVVRVQDLAKEPGIGEPLVRLVGGDVFHLGAHPDRPRRLAGPVHVGRKRQRLDERAHPLLRVPRLLFRVDALKDLTELPAQVSECVEDARVGLSVPVREERDERRDLVLGDDGEHDPVHGRAGALACRAPGGEHVTRQRVVGHRLADELAVLGHEPYRLERPAGEGADLGCGAIEHRSCVSGLRGRLGDAGHELELHAETCLAIRGVDDRLRFERSHNRSIGSGRSVAAHPFGAPRRSKG